MNAMSAKPDIIAAKQSGVYRAPANVASLRKQAEQVGLKWIELPLKAVATKAQFLAACAKHLKLPAHFGVNWDALADCVRDLGWLSAKKGYVLHLSSSGAFAKGDASEYQTALSVLREAADFWKVRGTPFVVLVDGAGDLPDFTA